MVQYANQAFARMVGRSDEELVGMDCAAIFGYDTALRLYKQLDVAIQSEQSFMFKDVMWLQFEEVPLSDHVLARTATKAAVITGTVSVFRDITQLVDAPGAQPAYGPADHRPRSCTLSRPSTRIWAASPRTWRTWAAIWSRPSASARKTRAPSARLPACRRSARCQLPRELLTKPGAFTPEERQAMERHVEYARETLKNINFELPVVEAISQMNEFMDGSGYPEKLHGDEIGICGRILSVANTFCALIRPRSYRNAKSVDVALNILESESAKYDQHVVHALREYLKTPAGEKFVRSLADENA